MVRILQRLITMQSNLIKNQLKLFVIFTTLLIAAILPLTIQTKVKLLTNLKS